MPKQKIKRHDRMYAGPYWISTRDGKPNVHRYNPKLDTATECNEAALAGNAIPSLPKGISCFRVPSPKEPTNLLTSTAPPVETGRPGASTPEEGIPDSHVVCRKDYTDTISSDGLIALAVAAGIAIPGNIEGTLLSP